MVHRSQGVTQSQLGKEFKTGGNKMFYVVKSLEARGLVVRHATIVRTHQPASKGPNNKFVPIVATNLVHLSRYEKDQSLGSHARYEIPSSSKSNLSHNNASGSGDVGAGEEDANQATEEVLINDDYPAMQRICEKLESAEDKVHLFLRYAFSFQCIRWNNEPSPLCSGGVLSNLHYHFFLLHRQRFFILLIVKNLFLHTISLFFVWYDALIFAVFC